MKVFVGGSFIQVCQHSVRGFCCNTKEPPTWVVKTMDTGFSKRCPTCKDPRFSPRVSNGPPMLTPTLLQKAILLWMDEIYFAPPKKPCNSPRQIATSTLWFKVQPCFLNGAKPQHVLTLTPTRHVLLGPPVERLEQVGNCPCFFFVSSVVYFSRGTHSPKKRNGREGYLAEGPRFDFPGVSSWFREAEDLHLGDSFETCFAECCPKVSSPVWFCCFGVPLFSTNQAKKRVCCWGPNSSLEKLISSGCQNRLGIPFWLVGEFTTHFRAFFRGDWDVHWGYGILTRGHILSRYICSLV